MATSSQTVVIGAGVGGLTAAALLLRAGHRVTVLEAQTYPGGSAGTYFHKGYRFDAGATLAGGFSPGGPHARVAEALGLTWPISPVDPAWVVHLPDGRTVTQWADPDRWTVEWQRVFPDTGDFWRQQKLLADISWDISSRPFPWPPRSPADLTTLAAGLRPKTLLSLPYLTTTIGLLAPADDPMFRAFLDGQLLISAQTTAERANALYGSAALDLPRRGVNHVHGGIGALADTLVAWIRDNGGEVLFRQRVAQISRGPDGRVLSVTTDKGRTFSGDRFLGNLTPWALVELLGEGTPPAMQREVAGLRPTWGAFTLYVGLARDRLPAHVVGHHQVIVDHTRPLGEGNSVFVSLSDPGDAMRAPDDMIAATLSTHTDIGPWWVLRNGPDEDAYLARRESYTDRLLAAAETAIPGFRAAADLVMPGTPVTFEFYTGRPQGMVGGFAQTSIFSARGPQTGLSNLWLVGDSIFPGQSTAGVTLGAMRVAADVLRAERASGRRISTRPAPFPAHER
jgi:C-3',4' desaturase CrtD